MRRTLLVLSVIAFVTQVAAAQTAVPQQSRILGIRVEGVEDENSRIVVQQTSGLSVGQEVTIPGDELFAEAIKRLYRLGSYSHIEIVSEQNVAEGVFLVIRVEEQPLLASYEFKGIRRTHADDLKKTVPLLRGRPVRPTDIEQTRKQIAEYFLRKGHPLLDVQVERNESANGRVDLVFRVDRGERIEITDLVVTGNEQISSRSVRKKLKNVREDRWWRFWKKDTFKQDKYEEDIQKLIAFYNERGYYDARVVRDSVYLYYDENEKPGMRVEIELHEGPRYYVRNITWDGNVTYTDTQLSDALGLRGGDVFNASRLEKNLFYTEDGSDVSSLYMNRGYMQFRVIPTIRQAPGDSLDLSFELYEGDIFQFGEIKISGNTKTKEHVIRREIETVPGNTFSRSDIQNTMMRLSQLSYFDQEKLFQGLGQELDVENKTVDLSYEVAEVSTDQLQFSGGWGGTSIGVLLQVGVNFNNFSIQNLFNKKAWKPLPAGDGQKFSLSVQTSGRAYQNMSASFSEPWLGGRARPFGASVFYSRYNLNAQFSIYDTRDIDTSETNEFSSLGTNLSYGRRLEWPDRFFQLSSGLGYRLYNVNFSGLETYRGLPVGRNQEITIRALVSRNTQFPALFPRQGSSFSFGVTVAPPIPGFIQYHKWSLNNSWLLPITEKISFSVGMQYGYLGSLTGKNVDFGRYVGGGDPLSSQYVDFGTDIVYMRGYPTQVITLRNEQNDEVGGRVLNKYNTELRLLVIQSQQFSLEPYLFFDAMNVWENLSSYQPTNLFRSAGIGARLFLPILGMVEINYGRNLDTYLDRNEASVSRKWLPQFTMGVGF